MEKEEH